MMFIDFAVGLGFLFECIIDPWIKIQNLPAPRELVRI